jgi:hypothetical protein
MVATLRAQPNLRDSEIPRIRASLKRFRPIINDLIQYYAAEMPLPEEVKERILVTDRFASLMISSDGHLCIIDCDNNRISEYQASESEMSSWQTSFNRLRSLHRFLEDGLSYGDDVWISCLDPQSNLLRVPLAGVRLYERALFRGPDGKFRAAPHAGRVFEITTLSTEWLRSETATDTTA